MDLVCCILHNILIDGTDIEEFVEPPLNISETAGLFEELGTTSIRMKRQMLYNHMLQNN